VLIEIDCNELHRNWSDFPRRAGFSNAAIARAVAAMTLNDAVEGTPDPKQMYKSFCHRLFCRYPSVIPAQAEIHTSNASISDFWISSCTGMSIYRWKKILSIR
jgi:hypothetical protein